MYETFDDVVCVWHEGKAFTSVLHCCQVLRHCAICHSQGDGTHSKAHHVVICVEGSVLKQHGFHLIPIDSSSVYGDMKIYSVYVAVWGEVLKTTRV